MKWTNIPVAKQVSPNEMIDEDGNRLKSFDESFDILLNNKKALASDTLFTTKQAECLTKL